MRIQKCQPVHRFARIFTGLALLGLGTISAGAQAARPVVTTNFVIESPNHKNNFTPATARRAFELKIASELAHLCQDRFAFLNWTSIDAATAGPLPTAGLTLSLKPGSGPFPAIVLEYQAVILGQAHTTGVENAELFGGFDDQFANDHQALENKLVAKLREQFANDSFRRDLHEGLLRHVPLATTVTLQQPQVIIPVNFGDLAPSDESVLLVQFRAKQNGTSVEGTAELIPLGQVQGALSCLIQKLLSPMGVVDHAGGWDPSITVLTQPPTVESLNVFMRIYKQRSNPGTEGTLATRPE